MFTFLLFLFFLRSVHSSLALFHFTSSLRNSRARVALSAFPLLSGVFPLHAAWVHFFNILSVYPNCCFCIHQADCLIFLVLLPFSTELQQSSTFYELFSSATRDHSALIVAKQNLKKQKPRAGLKELIKRSIWRWCIDGERSIRRSSQH